MAEKTYIPDKKQNADLIRCASFVLEMVKKYGPAVQAEHKAKANSEKTG